MDLSLTKGVSVVDFVDRSRECTRCALLKPDTPEGEMNETITALIKSLARMAIGEY